MSLGKIIYWIGVLSNVSTVLGFAIIILLLSCIGTAIITICNYFDCNEDAVKKFSGIFKKLLICLFITSMLNVFIPSKNEMYIITFTKDYTVTDIYKMTKEEVKSSIDYFVEQIKEIKEK